MKIASPNLVADDERFHELLAEYLRRVNRGEDVDQAAFQSAHPEYAAAFAEYFEGASRIEEMAGPRVGPSAAQGTVHGQFDAETSADMPLQVTLAKARDRTDKAPPDVAGNRAIPESFGRYKILKELGQGAMGAVYLAQDTQLQRQVALKIPKFSAAEAADMLERFYREARAAARLRHPNICPVYDVGDIDGQHYITMAFIEGRPLKDYARSKKLQPERQVAGLVRKLALGLAEAHSLGIIHRDLKPANIMVDAKGEPVVMDFGLARREEGDDKHVTRSGAILGTPAYMSPEQVEGDQSKIGPPADIYSLGVVMYELLTGKVPFGGSLMSILMQIASEQPQPPALHRPGVDPRLEAICLKMMAKKAADRYGSMNEVAQALGEYLKSPAAETSRMGLQTRPESLENQAHSVTGLDANPSFPGESSSASVENALAGHTGNPIAADPPGSLTVVPGKLHASSLARSASKDVENRSVSKGQENPTSLTRRVISTPKTWLAVGSILVSGLILLAAVTLYIRLGNVDVKVVIHDKNLAVKFGKQTVTFEGSDAPIRLRPGERKFIVELDGLEAETDNFVVKKEGKNILEVSLVDGHVVITKDGHPSLVKRKPESIDKANGWHGWPKDAPSPAIAPFDAKQAKAHQEAWAKYLNLPVEYTNSIGMKFRLIPPGEFLMGSTPAEIEEALKVVDENKDLQVCIKSEAPKHEVILEQTYYLGVHEVTQGEYEKGTGKNPSHFAASGPGKDAVIGVDTSRFPVEMVTWSDAAEFCAMLSEKERLKPFYFRSGEVVTMLRGTGYRLPTEAQWEFACRAGTTTRYWIGDEDEQLLQTAWFGRNSGQRSHAVGELQGNPFGLYDTQGNVWEWVQDGWDAAYYVRFQEQPALDPEGPTSAVPNRVFRGGRWSHLASHCRSARRQALPSVIASSSDLGFRVALSVEAVKAAIEAREANLADVTPSTPSADPRTLDRELLRNPGCEEPSTDSMIPGWEEVKGRWQSGGRKGNTPVYEGQYFFRTGKFRMAELAQNVDVAIYAKAIDAGRQQFTFSAHVRSYEQDQPDQTRVVVEYRDAPNGKILDHYDSGLAKNVKFWKPLHDTRLAPVGTRWIRVRLISNRTHAEDNNGYFDGLSLRAVTESATSAANASLVAPPPANAPFDAKQAKTLQEAWAKYLDVPVEYENSIGMKFRLIPPGEFTMGSTPAEVEEALKLTGEDKLWQERIKSEAPQHKVILTQPIYLGVHEVTQAEYEKVMKKNPSYFAKTGPEKQWVEKVAGLDTSRHPVEGVSWNDAAEWCAKLSEQEKLKPFYFRSGETVTPLDGTGYRLPTEAEWEFACRAGTTTKYWIGDKDEDLMRAAWFGTNSGSQTHKVGELKMNPLGLYDIHGNVWEWVQDCWEATYYEKFQEKPALNPNGQSSAGSLRTIRGGDWYNLSSRCRASNRVANVPVYRGNYVGFRVALPVDAVKSALAARPRKPTEVVDLLKLVDAGRDAVHGKWSLTADGLASDGSVPFCRLKFPYQPPAEYDFRIEFTADSGNDILQLLTAGDRDFTWLMGAWGGKYDAFDTVNGHPVLRKGTNLIGGPSAIRRGQRHTSVVEVRRDSISARIDGQLVVRHETDGADLGMPGEWSIGKGAIGLGTTHDTVVFHKAEIAVPTASNKSAGWYGWPKDAPPPAIAPFDAKQAQARQEAWATYLNVPIECENSIGMKFRLVPPGEFTMGSKPAEIAATLKDISAKDSAWRAIVTSEAQRRKVTLTQPLYVGIHEVTQAQFTKIMGRNPSYFSKTGDGKKDVHGIDTSAHPVEMVGWTGAVEFCRNLSEHDRQAGSAARQSRNSNFRLLTEAEWEFACRAGTTTVFSTGDKGIDLAQTGWFEANSKGHPHPVGQLQANAFGLHDMHGNVWEWVQDWWDADFYTNNTVDPLCGSSKSGRRIMRGGNCYHHASYCRASGRHAIDPAARKDFIGFRVALPIDVVKESLSNKPSRTIGADDTQNAIDREADGTVFPAYAAAPLHLVKQKDEYSAVREELEKLRKSSKQNYHVVILPTLGDYLPRPADYLRQLAAEWEQQAAERKLSFDAKRLVIIVMALNDQQLQIHFGPTLKDGLGLDGPPVTKELLVPHFLSYAREGKMNEGLISLLRGTEKWIVEHEAAKEAPAK